MCRRIDSQELLFFVSLVLCAETSGKHEDVHITGCSGSGGGESLYGLDSEELWFADFRRHTEVLPQPDFTVRVTYPRGYEHAVASLEVCRDNLVVLQQEMRTMTMQEDPPTSVMIYTKAEVQMDTENILICHVSGFYPAPVLVFWTRNLENVTDGASINKPFPNQDSSFQQTSRLQFTPRWGDVYSCRVHHPSLLRPLARFWEVKLKRSCFSSLFFSAAGLLAAVIGVTVGTFFRVKAK